MSYRVHGYEPPNYLYKAYKAIEWFLHAEWMCKDRWWERLDG